MTYVYRALKDGPIALYSMDSGPLADSSGYGVDGTSVVGQYSITRPITANGKAAYQFQSTGSVTYPIQNLQAKGFESKSYSLEFWFKPDVLTGTAKIFNRNNSGVFITSAGFSFNLEMGAGNTISAFYKQIEAGNCYHVVAVYDGSDAYLYVNGVMVATIPVTADNLAAGFADVATTLGISSASGAVFTVENAAVYQYALDAPTVRSHYNWGTAYPVVSDISAANNANVYRIFDGNSNFKARYEIDTEDEWSLGLTTGNLVVVDDALTQQYDTTNSVYYAGTWTYSVFMPQEAGVTLSGSRITWDANITNLDVQVSIDGGSTFTPVANGGSAFNNLSLDTADVELQVKVTMPSGVAAIVVPKIIIVTYVTKDIFGTNEDIPGLVGDEANATLAEYDYEPAAFNNNAGIKVATGTGGGITFPADPEFGSYYALETVVFADANPSATKTVFAAGTSNVTVSTSGQWTATNMTAIYVNGVAQNLAAPFAMDILKPNHVIFVFPAATGSLYLGNNAAGSAAYPFRIAYAATYRSTISATSAAAIYGAWVGNVANQTKEATKTNIFEHIYPDTGVAFRGYAYTWAITGSG